MGPLQGHPHLNSVQEVLVEAFTTGGFTTSSDYARANSAVVAQAASLGLLTTKLPDGSFSNRWRLARKGHTQLFKDQS